jgi:hypothetical protein
MGNLYAKPVEGESCYHNNLNEIVLEFNELISLFERNDF